MSLWYDTCDGIFPREYLESAVHRDMFILCTDNVIRRVLRVTEAVIECQEPTRVAVYYQRRTRDTTIIVMGIAWRDQSPPP